MDRQRGRTIFLDSASQVVLDPLTMDAQHSLLSTMSMIAPSPDWFSGVYNFNVLAGDTWYESFTLATFPWDAGTDSGDTYTSSNQATSPAQDIFQLTTDTIPGTNVFLSPSGDSVEPVATWTCTVQAFGPIVTPEPTALPTVPESTLPTSTGAPSITSSAGMESTVPTAGPSGEPTAFPTEETTSGALAFSGRLVPLAVAVLYNLL